VKGSGRRRALRMLAREGPPLKVPREAAHQQSARSAVPQVGQRGKENMQVNPESRCKRTAV